MGVYLSDTGSSSLITTKSTPIDDLTLAIGVSAQKTPIALIKSKILYEFAEIDFFRDI